MSSGKTDEMRMFTKSTAWWKPKPETPKNRDRSLSGKARIRARKEARRD